MNNQKPIVNAQYLLKKFPGKGGWTYIEIPEVKQNISNPSGWVKVKGLIDNYEIRQCRLSQNLVFEALSTLRLYHER